MNLKYRAYMRFGRCCSCKKNEFGFQTTVTRTCVSPEPNKHNALICRRCDKEWLNYFKKLRQTNENLP